MWKQVERSRKFFGAVDLTAGDLKGAAAYVEGMAWQLLDPDPRRPTIMLKARDAYAQFLKSNPEAATFIHDEGLLYVLDKDLFNKNKKKFAKDPSMAFFTKAEFEKSHLYAPMFDGCTYHGVLLSKEEGAVDPHRLVNFMGKLVRSMGGKIHLNTRVERLSEGDAGVTLFATGREHSVHHACVLAVGATVHPGKLLQASGYGDSVPEIYGIKGYSVTARMPANFVKMGVVDAVDTTFIRPFTDRQGNFCVRAGGIADPFDEDRPLEIKWDRLELFQKNQFTKKMFEKNSSGPKEADLTHDVIVERGKVEVWTGIRPVNRHGRVPLIRWVKGSKRVLVLSGFGSNGFVMCWHSGPGVVERFQQDCALLPSVMA